VRTTRYFEEQVLRKRPYIKMEWCERALQEPVRRDVQGDGCVVTPEDSMTVHNAFFDRGFKETAS
jgi:hypothetical protein